MLYSTASPHYRSYLSSTDERVVRDVELMNAIPIRLSSQDEVRRAVLREIASICSNDDIGCTDLGREYLSSRMIFDEVQRAGNFRLKSRLAVVGIPFVERNHEHIRRDLHELVGNRGDCP